MTDLITAYRKLVREKISKLTADIANGGGVTDYAQYRHMTGRIHGLRDAEDMIKEAMKKSGEDDDD